MKRETITVRLDEIQSNPDNPRTIKQQQLKKLQKSLREFPEMMQLRPIVVDENNVILGGNMRYQALKDNGTTKVEVIKVSGLTDKQKHEFIIKDNVPFGDWDWDKLANEWDATELESWGLELPDMDIAPDEIVEDEPPELSQEEPDSKAGEIYRLGAHLLLCGDSTDPETFAKLMSGELADLIVTDPPYNVDYQGKTRLKLNIKNDNMSTLTFVEFLTKANTAMLSALKPGGVFYQWYAALSTREFFVAAQNANMTVRQQLVWVKNSFVLGHQDYQWRHEPCIYGWKDGATHYFIDSRTQDTILDKVPDYESMNKAELLKLLDGIYKTNEAKTTTINCKRPTRSDEHPTMKPIALIAYLIRNSSRIGETVLDPFGGSGSTLIACEQTGRVCRTVELDPHYCDVIRKRYWKFKHDGDEDGWKDGTRF